MAGRFIFGTLPLKRWRIGRFKRDSIAWRVRPAAEAVARELWHNGTHCQFTGISAEALRPGHGINRSFGSLGKNPALGEIEQKMLRTDFDEPAIHFCGARLCAKHQPQRVDTHDRLLLFERAATGRNDTAALRGKMRTPRTS